MKVPPTHEWEIGEAISVAILIGCGFATVIFAAALFASALGRPMLFPLFLFAPLAAVACWHLWRKWA